MFSLNFCVFVGKKIILVLTYSKKTFTQQTVYVEQNMLLLCAKNGIVLCYGSTVVWCLVKIEPPLDVWAFVCSKRQKTIDKYSSNHNVKCNCTDFAADFVYSKHVSLCFFVGKGLISVLMSSKKKKKH